MSGIHLWGGALQATYPFEIGNKKLKVKWFATVTGYNSPERS